MVFDPPGAGEELAHLAVVASFGEVLDEVDELVGVAVSAVPLDGLYLRGTHLAGETVGEKVLHGWRRAYIAFFGEKFYQLPERLRPAFYHLAV